MGMGGAGFPTQRQSDMPKDRGLRSSTSSSTGAECEPYLTSDYRQDAGGSRNESWAGLQSGIVACLTAGHRALLAVEDNKPDAASHQLRDLTAKGMTGNIEVVELKTKYPQGAERQISARLLPAGRSIPKCCRLTQAVS